MRWPLPALYSSKSHLPSKVRAVVAGADKPLEAELVDVTGGAAPVVAVAVAVDAPRSILVTSALLEESQRIFTFGPASPL